MLLQFSRYSLEIKSIEECQGDKTQSISFPFLDYGYDIIISNRKATMSPYY